MISAIRKLDSPRTALVAGVLFVVLTLAGWVVECVSAVPSEAAGDSTSYSLVEQLPTADVFVTDHRGRKIPLRYRSGHFVSPDLPGWNTVGVRQIEFDRKMEDDAGPALDSVPISVGRLATQCIWFHPSNRGPLTLQLRDLPAWSSVDGYIHLLPSADPKKGFSFEITQGQVELGQWSPPNKPNSFVRFQAENQTDSENIEFTVRTRKRGKNHICINAVFMADEEAQ